MEQGRVKPNMSEESVPVNLPGPSVNMDVNDGMVRTPKEFSQGLTLELSDEEIAKAFAIIVEVSNKYKHKIATVETLEALRDEAVTRLAEISVLATVDVAPVLNGEPPAIEILGKVSGDPIHDHGFDHERKAFEVQRATNRGEDYYGQKGPVDGKTKNRDRNQRVQKMPKK